MVDVQPIYVLTPQNLYSAMTTEGGGGKKKNKHISKTRSLKDLINLKHITIALAFLFYSYSYDTERGLLSSGMGLDYILDRDIDFKVLQDAFCNSLTVFNSALLMIEYSNRFISSTSSIVAASSGSESKAWMV